MTRFRPIFTILLATTVVPATFGTAPALGQARLAQAPAAPAAVDDRSAEQRADALVRRMTLDEKLAYVHGYFPPLADRKSVV